MERTSWKLVRWLHPVPDDGPGCMRWTEGPRAAIAPQEDAWPEYPAPPGCFRGAQILILGSPCVRTFWPPIGRYPYEGRMGLWRHPEMAVGFPALRMWALKQKMYDRQADWQKGGRASS